MQHQLSQTKGANEMSAASTSPQCSMPTHPDGLYTQAQRQLHLQTSSSGIHTLRQVGRKEGGGREGGEGRAGKRHHGHWETAPNARLSFHSRCFRCVSAALTCTLPGWPAAPQGTLPPPLGI